MASFPFVSLNSLFSTIFLKSNSWNNKGSEIFPNLSLNFLYSIPFKICSDIVKIFSNPLFLRSCNASFWLKMIKFLFIFSFCRTLLEVKALLKFSKPYFSPILFSIISIVFFSASSCVVPKLAITMPFFILNSPFFILLIYCIILIIFVNKNKKTT